MSELPCTHTFLQNIRDLYLKEVASLNSQQSNKPYNSGKPNDRDRSRVNTKGLAMKVFNPLPVSQITALYVASLKEVRSRYLKTGCLEIIEDTRYPQSRITMEELLLNMIVSYQMPSTQKRPPPVNNPKEGGDKKDNKKSRPKYVATPPRVILGPSDSVQLIPYFLPIPLPPESKVWKQIRYVLVTDNNKEKLQQLVPSILEAVNNGNISFCALSYFMHDEFFSRFLEDPGLILQALYIGPLKATTVEMFTSRRSEEFRKGSRAVLKEARQAAASANSFKKSIPSHIPTNHPELCDLYSFKANTRILISDLNGIVSGDGKISIGWALASFKKYSKKTYVEKGWKEENLYDLIWTIIVQRPQLKNKLCGILENEYHDHGAARYWRSMQPSQMSLSRIQNRNVTQIDLLAHCDEFLNFPPDVKSIRFVGTMNDMKILNNELDELLSTGDGSVYIGLDAEWSAYSSRSKATILQLATKSNIFIIDMENSGITNAQLSIFFTRLFMEPRLLKLGFQFGEDLTQMRAAVRQCRALYEPENVICVGRILSDLLELTEKREDSDSILDEVVPYFRASLNDISSTSLADTQDPDVSMESEDQPNAEGIPNGEAEKAATAPETAASRTIHKGLSTLCEKVLGKALDKREQCSVWDRRPLRPLQLRYAAMDAYCLLMLYDRCIVWSNRLGVPMDEIISKQSPIRVSLPLLSEEGL